LDKLFPVIKVTATKVNNLYLVCRSFASHLTYCMLTTGVNSWRDKGNTTTSILPWGYTHREISSILTFFSFMWPRYTVYKNASETWLDSPEPRGRAYSVIKPRGRAYSVITRLLLTVSVFNQLFCLLQFSKLGREM